MASNPYINKLVINGQTRLNLTGDTVSPAHLESGYTAHDASGAPIVGTLNPGGTIQETSGTFTIANGMSTPVTINLPFTPDLFVITTPDITMYGAQFNESVSFPFGATINGGKSTAFQTLAYVRSYPQLNQSDMLFSVVAEVGTNKVTITRAVTVRSNWGENNITNKSFTYYACRWEG